MLMVPITHVAVAQPNNAAPSFALPYQDDTRQVIASPDLVNEQAWFNTPEWQIGESEATQDIENGNLSYYENEDDFLASF